MITTLWLLICLAHEGYQTPIAAVFDTREECLAELKKSTAPQYWSCQGYTTKEKDSLYLNLRPKKWT